MNTNQYLDKQLENEMDLEVLPTEYQAFLDSQQPKITTEEDETWEQQPSF